MDIFSISNSSELITPLVPGLPSKESLTSVLASNTGHLGIPYGTQGTGSAFKEDLSTSSAELSPDTSIESKALSSNSSEMAGNDYSRVAQSFFNPVAASRLASSVETVDEGSTPDPVTGLSDTAQLVGTTSATINFQPAGAPVPTGYTADTGAAYGARGNGRTYGWVRQDNKAPLNISSYARDRNITGFEQRIDTLIHMQYPNTAAAAWEYALPNGRYSVTVSVGDQSPFDSTHRIRAEGVEVVRPFKGNSSHKFELGTATVNVSDGKLTIDGSGGTNTKINYLEFSKVADGNHPSVTGSSPASRQTGVSRSSAVNVDVDLVTAGEGVDPATLNTTNVQLYRTSDNALVPASSIGTSGGNDTIVYQPKSALASNTSYTFRVKEGVKDEAGAAFLPFSTTFTTGTSTTLTTPGVNFTKSTVFTGGPISTVTISPNKGKLYAAGLDGTLRRFNINPSTGALTGGQVFKAGQTSPLAGRGIIGLAFNPNISNDLYLWTTNNNPVTAEAAEDFSSKITKISLNGGETKFDGTVEDFIVGLPRSAKDHLSNSLAYGPDGALYMTQGSNSAMGAPDTAWFNRPERLLSGAVLRINQGKFEFRPPGGFNVQTETYKGVNNPQGNYNPNDPKWNGTPPVSVYASGVRNAYDLVWHSNGKLYVPTNGSAAGGNTPDNPKTTANEGLKDVATQNDYLFKVEKGGYYGHPNPKRGEYIMNGGNPTSGVDKAEVVAKNGYAGYPVGTQPEPNYKGFAYDFGRNRSPNGVIEYKSSTFNGALKNQILVTEYSGGDDILALKLDASGNVTGATQAASGFTDPLDIIEDTKNSGNLGTLYVAELLGGGTGGRITMLRPT